MFISRQKKKKKKISEIIRGKKKTIHNCERRKDLKLVVNLG